MKYVCDQCGQSIPFKSMLKQYKITHRSAATLYWMVNDCIRSFKNTGDLNRHVNQHTEIWYNCDFSTYRNKDKWNRESHQHMHVDGNEKYSCVHCGKKFKFNTQFKWHEVGGCELPLPEPDRLNSPEF